MFVASNLYKYATGSSSAGNAQTNTPTPANTRVKRRPNKQAQRPHTPANGSDATAAAAAAAAGLSTSPPPSYASVASGTTPEEQKQANEAKYAIIESLLQEQDLYKLLGIKKNAKVDEVRRGFLNRSRVCHPDKFQNYPPATEAFQKVSFAYEILSKPTSRRLYDVSGQTNLAAAMNSSSTSSNGDAGAGLGADDTLNGVLYSVFCEFMEGDFEMIRVMINALNEGNPSVNFGDETVESIEGTFRRIRDAMLAGRRYLSIIKFELIRLYEIQQSLRQLSYFNITGRLKLTLQLARVTINIPLAIDKAMKSGQGPEGAEGSTSVGADEYAASSSETESDDDDDDDQHTSRSRSQRPHATSSSNGAAAAASAADDDAFGIATGVDDDGDDSDSAVRSEQLAEQRAKERRRAARARRRAAKREQRAKLRGDDGGEANTQQPSSSSSTRAKRDHHQQQLQRRGLLPQTAVGLLKGVVMVLETSEAWVPGGGNSGNAAGQAPA